MTSKPFLPFGNKPADKAIDALKTEAQLLSEDVIIDVTQEIRQMATNYCKILNELKSSLQQPPDFDKALTAINAKIWSWDTSEALETLERLKEKTS